MRIDRRWPFATLPDGYAPISAGGRARRDGAARDRVQAGPTSPYMGIFSYLTGFGGRDMAGGLGDGEPAGGRPGRRTGPSGPGGAGVAAPAGGGPPVGLRGT